MAGRPAPRGSAGGSTPARGSTPAAALGRPRPRPGRRRPDPAHAGHRGAGGRRGCPRTGRWSTLGAHRLTPTARRSRSSPSPRRASTRRRRRRRARTAGCSPSSPATPASSSGARRWSTTCWAGSRPGISWPSSAPRARASRPCCAPAWWPRSRPAACPASKRAIVVTPGAEATLDVPDDPARLLVVDQLEELFTRCDDPERRTAFVAALLERRGPVAVGLRADLYGRLGAHPELAQAVAGDQVLLGAMTRAELERAVTAPAALAGLKLEPGLTELIVREVATEPGALPMLSHALRATWELRDGRTLTVDGYRRSGGVGVRDRADRRRARRRAAAGAARARPRRVPAHDRAGRGRRRLPPPRPDGRARPRGHGPATGRRAARAPGRRAAGDARRRRRRGRARGAHPRVAARCAAGWRRTATRSGRTAASATPRRCGRPAAATRPTCCAARAWPPRSRSPRQGACSSTRWSARTSTRAPSRRSASAAPSSGPTAACAGSSPAPSYSSLVAIAAGLISLAQRGQAQDAEAAAEAQALRADAERLGALGVAAPRLQQSLLQAVAGVELQDRLETRSSLLTVLQRNPAALGFHAVAAGRLHGDGRRARAAACWSPATTPGRCGSRTCGRGPRSARRSGSRAAVGIQSMAFAPDGRRVAIGIHLAGPLRGPRARRDHAPDAPAVVARRPEAGRDHADADDGLRAGRPAARARRRDRVAGGRHARRPADRDARRGRRTGALAARRCRCSPSSGSRTSASRPIARSSPRRSRGRRSCGTRDGADQAALRVRRPPRRRAGRADGRPGAQQPVPGRGKLQGGGCSTSGRGTKAELAEDLPTEWVLALEFTEDGKRLAVATVNGTVVWDLASGRRSSSGSGGGSATFRGSSPRATARSWSSAGAGAVGVWDVSGARRLGRRFEWAPNTLHLQQQPVRRHQPGGRPDGHHLGRRPRGDRRAGDRRAALDGPGAQRRGRGGHRVHGGRAPDHGRLRRHGQDLGPRAARGDAAAALRRAGLHDRGVARRRAARRDGRVGGRGRRPARGPRPALGAGPLRRATSRTARATSPSAPTAARSWRAGAAAAARSSAAWDARSGEERFIRRTTGQWPTFALHPDSRRLLVGDADGRIAVWDLASGKPVGAPLTHHGGRHRADRRRARREDRSPSAASTAPRRCGASRAASGSARRSRSSARRSPPSRSTGAGGC